MRAFCLIVLLLTACDRTVPAPTDPEPVAPIRAVVEPAVVRPIVVPVLDAGAAPDEDLGSPAATDAGAAAVEETPPPRPRAADGECRVDSDCAHKKLKCPCRVYCKEGTCIVERLQRSRGDQFLLIE